MNQLVEAALIAKLHVVESKPDPFPHLFATQPIVSPFAVRFDPEQGYQYDIGFDFRRAMGCLNARPIGAAQPGELMLVGIEVPGQDGDPRFGCLRWFWRRRLPFDALFNPFTGERLSGVDSAGNEPYLRVEF